MNNLEKNESEIEQNNIDNSNQEKIDDVIDELRKKRVSEFERDLNTFDQNDEAQKSNINQEKMEEENHTLSQKDEANKDNDNQGENEDSYNELVNNRDCNIKEEYYIFDQKNEAKESNTEEKKNESENIEIKSTGVGSIIEEEKKEIVEKHKIIPKNPGETSPNFSSEKKALNSSDNQNQNKELYSGSSQYQPEKSNNENAMFFSKEGNNYDSESILIGNKIKRGSESPAQSESSEGEENNDCPNEFNKDNSLLDMINCQGDEITESQINKSCMTASNRKRFNKKLLGRVNESDFLTRDHVSSGLYKTTCNSNSAFP